jgi:ligand-binding SRPBCC domain-containing protein
VSRQESISGTAERRVNHGTAGRLTTGPATRDAACPEFYRSRLMAVFEHEQTLACEVEQIFDFLTRPANVARLALPENQLTFLSAPEVLAAGVELEFEIRAYGQRQSVVHEIVELDRPWRVLERMVHGPLEDWEHEHLFESGPEGARIVDRITFLPPRGLIGLLLTEERIVSSLERGFAHQRRLLEEFVARGELA